MLDMDKVLDSRLSDGLYTKFKNFFVFVPFYKRISKKKMRWKFWYSANKFFVADFEKKKKLKLIFIYIFTAATNILYKNCCHALINDETYFN